jgi:ketosteroid isomerase-like protein
VGSPEENLAIVRRAHAGLERRDWRALADLADPEIELHGTVGGLEEGKVLRGLDQIAHAFESEDSDVWDEHRIEIQNLIVSGDRVIALQREYQRSKSGVETVIDTAAILDLRAGRIVRIQGYMDPAAALRDAGVEHRTSPDPPG